MPIATVNLGSLPARVVWRDSRAWLRNKPMGMPADQDSRYIIGPGQKWERLIPLQFGVTGIVKEVLEAGEGIPVAVCFIYEPVPSDGRRWLTIVWTRVTPLSTHTTISTKHSTEYLTSAQQCDFDTLMPHDFLPRR